MNVQFICNYPFTKEFILIEISVSDYHEFKHITVVLLGFGIIITTLRRTK